MFRNCTSGINVEGATSGSYRIANNVAVDNAVYPAYAGIACARRAGNIGVWDGAQNTTLVDHNLVYLTKTGDMYAWGTTYTTPRRDAARPPGRRPRGVQADPKFSDAGTWDLSLTRGLPGHRPRRQRRCPARRPPTSSGYPRVRDPNVANTFAAGPRLYDDLGAYEFQPDVAAARGAAAGRGPDADADHGTGPARRERRRVRVDRPAGPGPQLRVRLR